MRLRSRRCLQCWLYRHWPSTAVRTAASAVMRLQGDSAAMPLQAGSHRTVALPRAAVGDLPPTAEEALPHIPAALLPAVMRLVLAGSHHIMAASRRAPEGLLRSDSWARDEPGSRPASDRE